MSFESVDFLGLPKGDVGYRLTDEPCNGCLVAVQVTTDIQLDGEGHFAAQTFRAVARWVDARGKPKQFPGRDIPVTATNRHTNLDGSITAAEVISELLDGVDGNPKPLPSPIRRAITAATAMETAAKPAPKPAKK